MNCPNCGKDAVKSKFCPECGTKIENADEDKTVNGTM